MIDFRLSNDGADVSRRLFLKQAARAGVWAALGALSAFWVRSRRAEWAGCIHPAIADCRRCSSFQTCSLGQAAERKSSSEKSYESSAL
ncbi:MAG TPA: twin-arginine translocation signal domain-containing protein [Anaerohalosphaeraceae bacterium]|nr:twin-arginine translocation signal domain-containing protein [Anaerohalosphaeraceae bacterium]HOL87810.1 twin-arginine translocation signal domain-containing protein [Anaerohalosphaeraceae bacterium]HPP55162.1 twin-arginine translocation signal domain-containing protein [Anaerohalosphaeraceae bacterium]